MQKKKSIRDKILWAFLRALLLYAILMSVASLFFVNRLAKDDATDLMTQLCAKEGSRLDNKLNLVKHSVSILYDYINEKNNDDSYEIFSEEYGERICDQAISIANMTDGAMAVYYRYSPELTGNGTGGFFWSRSLENTTFSEEPPTDILAFEATDIEHVGWFYVPKETGKPLWMKPYYNQNLDVFMISYIIPIYNKEKEFLGVVGMDIDFNSIMTAEGDIKLYETGTVALVDLSEQLIYSEKRENGTYSDKLSDYLYDQLTTIGRKSDILEIKENDGSKSIICCEQISNGMILYVNVPKNEIYASRNHLVMVMSALTVILIGITVLDIRRNASQITKPINQLAEITGYYAEGDWNHDYVCNSGDELQILSRSIQTMAKNTQEYLTSLNDLARKDGLTGLKNKTAYFECVEDIKVNRHNKYNQYSVIVMDLNLLKKTNDNFGHEAGDILLAEASNYICKTFTNSSAFRIGGDEFVVILTEEDYKNCVALCDAFEKGMNYEVGDLKGVVLSVSYGLASFPEDASDYDSLFKVADERMYEKKKEMKMQREN